MKTITAVNTWTQWTEYIDPAGETTEAEYDGMSMADRVTVALRCFGIDAEDDIEELREILGPTLSAELL